MSIITDKSGKGSSRFIKNFRDTEAERKLPFSDNDTGTFISHTVVPFAYKEGDGTRRFGIVHVPGSQGWRNFPKEGKYDQNSDVENYGAELMDGTDLTAKGWSNFYNKHRKDIEFIDTGNHDNYYGEQWNLPEDNENTFYQVLRRALDQFELTNAHRKASDEGRKNNGYAKMGEDLYKITPEYKNFLQRYSQIIKRNKDATNNNLLQEFYNNYSKYSGEQ